MKYSHKIVYMKMHTTHWLSVFIEPKQTIFTSQVNITVPL